MNKIITFLIAIACANCSFAQTNREDSLFRKIDLEVQASMKTGNIPGLSLIIIRNNRQTIRNYGYADREAARPVSNQTLFELGSCSKAFTALAIAKLVRDSLLRLEDPVSAYIPWFRCTYKDIPVKITINQLLHHTSGIPWSTISRIPQTDSTNALEMTVRQLEGMELARLPGSKYEYATMNYDVLALIVQQIARQPFEDYLQHEVIDELGMSNTTIGYPIDNKLKSNGYKIGFFKAREYSAPAFRGNNAAGYVTSDAVDMAKWLEFQMGIKPSALYDLAQTTQKRDETVAPHFISSYAMGWQVSLAGDGEIYHDGLNPNFTSYVAFRPKQGIGIALLANSNSTFTPVLGNRIMKLLAGEAIEKEYDPGDNNDKVFSIAALVIAGYCIIVLAFLMLIMVDITKGKRKYEGFSPAKLGKLVQLLVSLLPFLYGLYILPKALFNFSWNAIMVWTPISFSIALKMVILAIGISYLTYLTGLCFPEKNTFKKIAPKLLLLSILSGFANMLVIILITSSLDSTVKLEYLIFYYVLTLLVYLLGRKFVQTNLIRFTMGAIYELRVQLLERIFSSSFQNFEKIDRGYVYTVMNDDVNTIGESTNLFVMLITSFFTSAGALLYLASIAFWATLLTVFLILTLTVLYYFVGKSTNRYFEEARDTRNAFMRLINGMIDGFKEISLHKNKKKEYKDDVAASANEYRVKMSLASIRFVNASLVGETVLIVILGVVAFAFPKFFPGIKTYTLMSFVIVLLYLIGPVNTILSSVPSIMRLRIAWKRIRGFLDEIPSGSDPEKGNITYVTPTVDSIRAEGLRFQYKEGGEQKPFTVGPIDLEIKGGEILFIIGANGSGKTTLARLLTGLYKPDKGQIRINGQVVESAQLGEYFSAVFSPVYLFEKLYNIDLYGKSAEAQKYLRLLNLEEKVEINNNTYSTINLSGGQRKRLALLQCYLEDSPIYLFDEWAADQDPEYRFFFYRTLLPEMRKKGKIIIAVTHDDHYFDVADKVLKMNQGKLDQYAGNYLWAEEPADSGA